MNEGLFFLVVFLTNIIQAITGFAGTMLAMPISIKLIGMDPARIALNIVAIAISLYIVWKDYNKINKSVLKYAVIWMFVGMLISTILYSTIDAELLLYIYGIMIITVSLKKIMWKKELPVPSALMKGILILAGIMQGLFASGGPLLVIYLVSKIKNKDEFRVTVSSIWIILGIVFMIQNANLVTAYDIKLSAVTMIPLALGVMLGSCIQKKIPQEKFMKITYVLLLISGLSVYI